MRAVDRMPPWHSVRGRDNIDVAGLPTTAACPAFSYVPQRSATVVDKLEAAGAIIVGKTNLDQFATGLVGTRSPFGVVPNTFRPEYICGGSSSGSAAVVARGLVSFALGTDTAGSGRVPAGPNNLVGLKPSRGLISARGLVPACQSLDCVSVFALTTPDAIAVLDAARGYDPTDPYSRVLDLWPASCGAQFASRCSIHWSSMATSAPGAPSMTPRACFRASAGRPPRRISPCFGCRIAAVAKALGGRSAWRRSGPSSSGTQIRSTPWCTRSSLAQRSFPRRTCFRASRTCTRCKSGGAALGAYRRLVVPTAHRIHHRRRVAEPFQTNRRLGHSHQLRCQPARRPHRHRRPGLDPTRWIAVRHHPDQSGR